MKTLKKAVILTLLFALVCGICAAAPKKMDPLDAAIRETSNYLNNNLPKGSKIVILNIQSGSGALSEYIIDELISNAVNDKHFLVVDRQQLDAIRAEQNFQFSGEVDDKQALEIGKFFGAQTIVSGAMGLIGKEHRLRVRALEVQSALVQGQFNKNISESKLITALRGSSGSGGSSSGNTGYNQPTTPRQTASSGSGAITQVTQTPTPAPVIEQAPTAPVPQAPAAPPTPVYKIGDTGPAGGLIFYDKGNSSGGWRYLEAAPADIGEVVWQSSYTDVTGTKEGIGSGKENTQLAIRDLCRPAMICDQYSYGEYDDWFLPSMDELNLMYINLKMIRNTGNFSDGWYWSSTQMYHHSAYSQYFIDGRQEWGSKLKPASVRAIRAF